ncbi:hypothetical protein LZ30DRAFT_238015 [Colletotrichum cereale]|nr:hypothetical protein LZ30DRAFT_238015 [Colletotrichum cereale]
MGGETRTKRERSRCTSRTERGPHSYGVRLGSRQARLAVDDAGAGEWVRRKGLDLWGGLSDLGESGGRDGKSSLPPRYLPKAVYLHTYNVVPCTYGSSRSSALVGQGFADGHRPAEGLVSGGDSFGVVEEGGGGLAGDPGNVGLGLPRGRFVSASRAGNIGFAGLDTGWRLECGS